MKTRILRLLEAHLWLTLLLFSTAVLNAGFAIFQLSAVAQSVLSSFTVTATNPTLGSDLNLRRAIDFNCNFTSLDATNTGFTNDACATNTLTSSNGQNVYGGGTDAKRSYINQMMTGTQYAAGQRFLWNNTQTCYGMGDCFLGSQTLTFATADNVAGDEGIGFQSTSRIQQQNHLTLASISSVPTPTTCNTTLTQSVTGSQTAQAVMVASTTNCVVNDWVVIGQTAPSANTSMEAVQITAVGGGTITGAFRNNHNSAATVTPAKVLVLDNGGSEIGQQRVLVNLSGTTYSTGTVSSISGGGFTGSGTSWANNTVGGSALNIGCVQLTADNYSGSPFDGSGSTGTLKSWYQISSIFSATLLGIFTYSTAGDGAYYGKGPGGYSIKPCAQVLFTSGSTVVLETTSTTWTAGNSVELAIPPYPDINGFQFNLANWTPGGAGFRSMFSLRNTGARTIGSALKIDSAMPSGGGADTIGWGSAVALFGKFNYGIYMENPQLAAIKMYSTNVSGLCTTDNCGKIDWGAQYLMPNSPHSGIDFRMVDTGNGTLSSTGSNVIASGSLSLLNYTGMLGTTPVTFSLLPTCAAGVAGAMVGITDSSTATFNATVTGGGANKGIAYCNGTNWTFH